MKFGQLQQEINIPFSMHILRLCRINCGKKYCCFFININYRFFFLGMNNDTAHTAITPGCLPRKYGKCYENTLTVHVKRLSSDAGEGPTKFVTFQTLYFI